MVDENRYNKKFVIIIIILSILLLASLGHIIVNKYNQSEQEKHQQCIQEGYQQAIIQIVQEAVTCKQIPIYIGNQTINLIAVECGKI